jgi:hypothetical protein
MAETPNQPDLEPVYKPTLNLTTTHRKAREIEIQGRSWIKPQARIDLVRGLPGGHLIEVKFPGSESSDLIPVDDWDFRSNSDSEELEL